MRFLCRKGVMSVNIFVDNLNNLCGYFVYIKLFYSTLWKQKYNLYCSGVLTRRNATFGDFFKKVLTYFKLKCIIVLVQ